MSRKPDAEPPLLVTRKEAARLLAVTERHLQNLERDGLFKPVRLGASVRYRRSDIDEVLRRLADGGGQ
jgi:excisionase family DNA binding protein